MPRTRKADRTTEIERQVKKLQEQVDTLAIGERLAQLASRVAQLEAKAEKR